MADIINELGNYCLSSEFNIELMCRSKVDFDFVRKRAGANEPNQLSCSQGLASGVQSYQAHTHSENFWL